MQQSMRVLCLNHRDELDRSTLDLDSRQKTTLRSMFQSQRRTRQHSRPTDRYSLETRPLPPQRLVLSG